MFAVIRTGGKQYVVQPGQEITIERLDGQDGGPIVFDEVLLINDTGTKLGTPHVAGAKVTGTIVKQGRAAKVIGIKFHNKVRYRRKFGHRQHTTKVKIDKITA